MIALVSEQEHASVQYVKPVSDLIEVLLSDGPSYAKTLPSLFILRKILLFRHLGHLCLILKQRIVQIGSYHGKTSNQVDHWAYERTRLNSSVLCGSLTRMGEYKHSSILFYEFNCR